MHLGTLSPGVRDRSKTEVGSIFCFVLCSLFVIVVKVEQQKLKLCTSKTMHYSNTFTN